VLLPVAALALHVLRVLEPGLFLARDRAVGLSPRLELLDVPLVLLGPPGLARAQGAGLDALAGDAAYLVWRSPWPPRPYIISDDPPRPHILRPLRRIS